VSNVRESDDEARALLETRLKKTEEILAQIAVLKNAIKPVEIFLGDITRALDANVSVNGKPADKVQTYLEILQKILRESTNGMVEYMPDGSWTLLRPLKLPLLGAHYQCDSSEVRIQGYRENNAEQLWIKVKDCSETPQWRPLVSLKLNSNGHLDTVLFPETVGHLFLQDIQNGQCTVKIESGQVDIHCKPLRIRGNGFSAVIDPLDYSKNEKQATKASIKVSVTNTAGKLIAEAELLAVPGERTKVLIRVL
jgi:hypothetical protein